MCLCVSCKAQPECMTIAVREGSYKVSGCEVQLHPRIWVTGTVQCALWVNVSATLRKSIKNLKVQAVARLDIIRTRCEGKGRGSPIPNYVLSDLVS